MKQPGNNRIPTRSFMFLLTVPLETAQRIEATDTRSGRLARIRRLLSSNRREIMHALEETVLHQIENPQELAELYQEPGGRGARFTTRSKGSVEELPE